MMTVDNALIARIFAASLAEEDNRIERQVVRATNKLVYEDRVVRNPLYAAAAEIMLKDFDPRRPIQGCSNGANRFAIYAAPRRL